LVLAVQAGDQTAFDTLANTYRPELLVHCYRMSGSRDDAEDLVQETLLRAWEKRATLTTPEAYRAWLYRIATNLCLNLLSRIPRRSLPSETHPQSEISAPLSPPIREPIWLEPFPDDFLSEHDLSPEDRTLQHEHLSLAFLVALQQLTPVQRSILLLREVLEWSAAEVADWINLSIPAVNSALQRARRTLRQHYDRQPGMPLAEVQTLHEHYMALWEQADIPGLVALMREDAWFTMPPIPTWFYGRDVIAAVFASRIFIPGRQMRVLATHANGSPAFAAYQRGPTTDDYRFAGLFVLDIVGQQIGRLDAFMEPSNLAAFALPISLPAKN
jgi:RNA polymerase sigma-70 factor (ECF subfamily)